MIPDATSSSTPRHTTSLSRSRSVDVKGAVAEEIVAEPACATRSPSTIPSPTAPNAASVGSSTVVRVPEPLSTCAPA